MLAILQVSGRKLGLMNSKSKSKKKKKLGRRLLREQPLSQHLNVRLTPSEMQVLRDYCWRYDCSASDIVRDSLAILGVIPDFGYGIKLNKFD